MPMPDGSTIDEIDTLLKPTTGVIKHVKNLISILEQERFPDNEATFAAEDVKSAYRIWLSSLVARLRSPNEATFFDKKELHDQGKKIVDRAQSFVRSLEKAGLVTPEPIRRDLSTRAELLEREADAGVRLLERFSGSTPSDRQDIATFVAQHDAFEAITD